VHIKQHDALPAARNAVDIRSKATAIVEGTEATRQHPSG